MSVFVSTKKGLITSYREAWKDERGRSVWTWRCDPDVPAFDFGSVEAAEQFRDETHHLSTPKEIAQDGWEILVSGRGWNDE